MTAGSKQLRSFRTAIRDGLPLEIAAANAGFSMEEARLTLEADAADPPPPEAFEMIGIGHNSQEKEPMSEGNVAADQLRLFIERIERLEEEKKGLADDIKDVYAEAKSTGYDVKTMREIVRLRKMEANARQEREALLETYMIALGMLAGTPLGDYAIGKAA